MIYVAGDSHTLVFNKNFRHGPVEPGFVLLYTYLVRWGKLGPTAYGLINDDSKSKFRKNFLITSRRMRLRRIHLLLSAGEIDCRLHIYNKHIKTGVPIYILIQKTIDRYEQFIDEMKARKYVVFILGIPPCGKYKRRRGIYPDPQMHSEIYALFNYEARKRCKNYIDVYSLAADSDGFIKNEYKQDNTHLNNKNTFPFILSELKKFGADVSF